MCLGVAHRGNQDEGDWFNERVDFFNSYQDLVKEAEENKTLVEDQGQGGYRSLLNWIGMHLMATQCSNKGAVIEWVLVPFIVEEDEPEFLSNENATSDPQVEVQSDDEEL